jgi:hypothetical protein
MASMKVSDTIDDKDLMERYLTHVLGEPIYRVKRGRLMDAYRTIAMQFGAEESTPRMWRSRGAIPRHVRRQILAMLNGENPDVATEDVDFDPAVMTVARTIQRIYERTGGKGEVWRSLLAGIELARTWSSRGAPVSLRHLRPMGGR